MKCNNILIIHYQKFAFDKISIEIKNPYISLYSEICYFLINDSFKKKLSLIKYFTIATQRFDNLKFFFLEFQISKIALKYSEYKYLRNIENKYYRYNIYIYK